MVTARETRGEVEVDAGQTRGHQVRRLWLEPEAAIHPAVAQAIRDFDAVIIGPGSFYTSLMPPLLVRGVKEALAEMRGPIILIANLLTEGRGMAGFTAAEAARWVSRAIDRPVDVVIANTGRPSPEGLLRYAAEHKVPLEVGELTGETEAVARPVLVHRDRAPRSPAPVVCRLERAQRAPAPASAHACRDILSVVASVAYARDDDVFRFAAAFLTAGRFAALLGAGLAAVCFFTGVAFRDPADVADEPGTNESRPHRASRVPAR